MTQFTQDQLDTAAEVIAAAVRENFPNVSVRKGTVMRELVVAASAIGFAVIDERLEQFRATQSLKNAEENPDLVDDSVIDAILSNYFITRKVGTLATGLIKVLVATNVDRTLPAGTVFTTGNDLVFLTESTLVAETTPTSATSLLIQQESGTGNYFFLVPVVAEEVGDQYSIAQDTQLDNETLGADFILATAFTTFSGGSDTESTADLLTRAQDAITVRDLTTRKAIRAVLPDEFPQIEAIKVMGYGDAEMRRDHANALGFGRGGRTDVYVRTSKDPVETVITKTVGGDLTVDLDTVGVEVPLYKVTFVALTEFPDLPLVEGEDYSLSFSIAANPSNDLQGLLKHARFTVYERATLTFTDPLLAGKGVTIKLVYPPDLQAIQTYVLDETERVVLADTLVKAITPCFVTLQFSYTKKSLTENIVLDDLRNDLKTYINTLAPGTPLAISRLIDIVHNYDVVQVDIPSFQLTGVLYKPDGTQDSLSTTNSLVIPEDLALGVSQNTVAYFITLDSILASEVLI